MRTEVSISPLAGRSGTWGRILVDVCVDVCAELFEVDVRGATERRHERVRRHEAPALHRAQLTHRHSASGDDELLTSIERSHDLATLVAKLPLGDRASHGAHCST